MLCADVFTAIQTPLLFPLAWKLVFLHLEVNFDWANKTPRGETVSRIKLDQNFFCWGGVICDPQKVERAKSILLYSVAVSPLNKQLGNSWLLQGKAIRTWTCLCMHQKPGKCGPWFPFSTKKLGILGCGPRCAIRVLFVSWGEGGGT